MDSAIILKSIHLLGVGVLVGVVFFSLYCAVKLRSIDQLKDFITLRRIGAAGAAVAILAGIAMAWRWFSYLLNDNSFLLKMGLVLADGVIAELIFIRILKQSLANSDIEGAKKRLLPWAIISVLIVIAIVVVAVYRSKS